MRAIVEKSFSFHAGHRLPRHEGKCRRLHGHTYRVDIAVEGIVHDNFQSDDGMVIDFDVIKHAWEPIHDELDHKFLLDTEDPLRELLQSNEGASIVVFPYAPTAENIATWIFERLVSTISLSAVVRLQWVRVWETPTSSAEVR